MNQGLYLAVFLVAITLIAFCIRPLVQPEALSETRKLEWVHEPAELHKISENSPYVYAQRAVGISCARNGKTSP
jgi:hypothetical protein